MMSPRPARAAPPETPDVRSRAVLGFGLLAAGVLVGLSIYAVVDACWQEPPPAPAVEPGPASVPASARASTIEWTPPAPALPPARSAEPPPVDPTQPYGDYKFRENLYDTQDAQYRMLMEQAKKQPTNAAERDPLALTPEAVENLKKRGALIE